MDLISNRCKTFVQKIGITHTFTAHYHPSSNAMAEWSLQTFKNAVKKIINRGKNVIELNTIFSRYLLHYRAMSQSTTGKSPTEMLYNCKLNTWLILLKQSVSK